MNATFSFFFFSNYSLFPSLPPTLKQCWKEREKVNPANGQSWASADTTAHEWSPHPSDRWKPNVITGPQEQGNGMKPGTSVMLTLLLKAGPNYQAAGKCGAQNGSMAQICLQSKLNLYEQKRIMWFKFETAQTRCLWHLWRRKKKRNLCPRQVQHTYCLSSSRNLERWI